MLNAPQQAALFYARKRRKAREAGDPSEFGLANVVLGARMLAGPIDLSVANFPTTPQLGLTMAAVLQAT